MATRLQKILWSVLCGTALGLGVGGCYDSDDGSGPPGDASADADGEVADAPADVAEEEELSPLYGAPEYGPPWP